MFPKKALNIITASEIWNRLACYGILTFLVLHLTRFFHFDNVSAFKLYGTYTTLAYGAPLLGGFIADNYLGYLNAMKLGALFLIAGNVLLATRTLPLFYLGLAFSILGMGLSRGNSQSLLGISYKNVTEQRAKGFTFFYIAMNIGSALGPLLYGLLAIKNPSLGFAFSIMMISTGFLILCYFTKELKSITENSAVKVQPNKAALSASAFVFLTYFLFQYAAIDKYFFYLLFSALFLSSFWFFQKQTSDQKRKWLTVFLLSFFCICFFSASLQLGSSITLFISKTLHLHWFGHVLPANFYGAMDPIAIILCGPFFLFLWKALAKKQAEPNVLFKIALGLLFAILGFFSLYLDSTLNTHTLLFLILANLALGAGEICLAPSILASISENAPIQRQGIAMGIWYISCAIGGYLSGIFAQVSSWNHAVNYSREFLVMIVFISVFAMIAILLGIRRARLLNNDNAT